MKNFKLLLISLLSIVYSFNSIAFINENEINVKTNNVKTNQIGITVGKIAPKISMKSPNGEIFSLYELRGKIVLLDFWASWCSPCRKENPSIVKAYKKYKNAKFKNNVNGFEVFSVSLDKDIQKWKNAIKTDDLIWKYHVSDLKGWNNVAAKIYGVNAIPTNFLLDENGIIIGKNLRRLEIFQEIEKLLK